MDGEADREFARLAGEYIDDRAERHPELATSLGDHRFDDRLSDPSEAARADERRSLDGWAARLDALDLGALSAEHRVDAAMMTDSVARRVFELDELAEDTWNPLLANPGRAIYQLLARDFAPLPDRLASVAGRLAEVPAVLAEARRQLGAMPRVHLETAIGQFDGALALVGKEVDGALAAVPSSGPSRPGRHPAVIRAVLRAILRSAAGRGPPRPGGSGRAPGLAVRAPGRGGARAGRRPEPADRARAVRPQALAHAERGRRRGRHPGPGPGRPGPGQRADRVALRRHDGSAVSGPAVVRQVLDRLAQDVARRRDHLSASAATPSPLRSPS